MNDRSVKEQVNKTKRKLKGVVVSAKNAKTIVVKVERLCKHNRYAKVMTKTKKFHAHDEKVLAKEGDLVTIIESRPYSKLKRWNLFLVH